MCELVSCAVVQAREKDYCYTITELDRCWTYNAMGGHTYARLLKQLELAPPTEIPNVG